jgi:hypothetical protein
MAAVERRPEPRKFLDASLTPLERALRARADDVTGDAGRHRIANEVRKQFRIQGLDDASPDGLTGVLADVLAGELRALADELHHW